MCVCVCVCVCVRVCVPPTANGKWREGDDLKSHQTDGRSWGSSPQPLVYKSSGISITQHWLPLEHRIHVHFATEKRASCHVIRQDYFEHPKHVLVASCNWEI